MDRILFSIISQGDENPVNFHHDYLYKHLSEFSDLCVPRWIKGADVCWFGTPFICDEQGLKHKLVQYLEDNKIQTRNYFTGNVLMHPGYGFLDDYKKYPESNKVLDKVFFIGAAPHYKEIVFKYIEDVIKKF